MSQIQPQRIQRKRTLGFRLQAESIAVNGLPARSITRGTYFGNPFPVSEWGEDALSMHETWLTTDEWLNWEWLTEEKKRELLRLKERAWKHLPELRGKNPACFCPKGQKCHGDLYVRLANQ